MEICVSDDELIKMITKGNEEAKWLLFLRYEKKIRYRWNNNEFPYDKYRMDIEELVDMALNIVNEIIPRYNPHIALFSTYFSKAFQRGEYKILIKNSQKNEYMAFDYSLDEDVCSDLTYFLKDSVSVNVNRLEFDNVLLLLSKEKELTRKVIKMWLEGYSYLEIANAFHINKKKVNNVITYFIAKVKKHYSL